MSIADDASGVSRFNLARKQVEKWWERLSKDFDLHMVAFSERGQPLDDIKDLAAAVPDGKATSLSRALVAAADVAPRKDVEAMILLSDGIHNSAAQSPGPGAQAGNVVHTVGVGATLRSNAKYSRHAGHGHRLPRPADVEQQGQDHGLDRRHRAGRPRVQGDPGGRRPGRCRNRS